MITIYAILHSLRLFLGWILDFLLGDPACLPHPVVLFGKIISHGERLLNRGSARKLKGFLMSAILVLSVFLVAYAALHLLGKWSEWLVLAFEVILVFFCLAGSTLIKEVRDVFKALDKSLESGRMQVSRIVGRDTSELSAQDVRTAALETLAENLSDGVIAPIFWFAVLGLPGMLAYKMINTLDSMIGYRTERYKDFGCFAARMDDVFNYIPARITALLMIMAAGKPQLSGFVAKYGRKHASPNSGYPEAALAGILKCRFGGSHYYFGEYFHKPYIGTDDRALNYDDMLKSVKINRTVEIIAVVLVSLSSLFIALSPYI